MAVEIQRAEGNYATELTAIAFAAKRYWGYPEEWIRLWAEELSVDAAYIDANAVYAARDGGRILGWCAVVEEGGEHWLDYCWVLPEAAGRGIGKQLVRRALAAAAESASTTLKVIADPNAEDFYRRFGFERIGMHPSVPEGRSLPVLEANIGPA